MTTNGAGGSYAEFLDCKSQLGGEFGFEPLWIPDFLFDFQKALVDWAIRKGRGAIFANLQLSVEGGLLAYRTRLTSRKILLVILG